MTTIPRRVPRQLLTLLALMTSASCTEQRPMPTEPPGATHVAPPSASFHDDLLAGLIPDRATRGQTIRITSLTIVPNALTIGGSGTPGTSATWTATIENATKQTLGNVIAQTYFYVYLPDGGINAFRPAGGAFVSCGGSFGFLFPGTCTLTGTAVPSNDVSGSGFLVPDDPTHDARFELHLRRELFDGGPPLLLTKASTDVTLFFQLQ